jgi:trk system potassium uptake protein TrkA
MRVVITGGGKVGEFLASQLLAHRHKVAIIEIDEKQIEQLVLRLQHQVMIVCGDGCDSSFQKDAGVDEADVFVATTGADDVNLVSCEIATMIHKVPRSIARVNSPKNERIFRRVGIEAVSSTSVISRMIESEALTGVAHAVMTLTQGNLVVTELVIRGKLEQIDEAERVADAEDTVDAADAKYFAASTQGRRVADIKLPEGALLIAVEHEGKVSIVNGSTVLYPGDTVVCVSQPGVQDRISESLL